MNTQARVNLLNLELTMCDLDPYCLTCKSEEHIKFLPCRHSFCPTCLCCGFGYVYCPTCDKTNYGLLSKLTFDTL